MNNFYDQTRVFKFNLVPPKSKEEIGVLVERDNSILYSVILVFAALLIYLILNIMQTVLVTPKLDIIALNTTNVNTAISNYDLARKTNGELFIKSKTLEPILQKDIKLTQLLGIGQQIITQIPGTAITSYSRENSGTFLLTFNIASYDQSITLIKTLKSFPQVSDVFLRIVSMDIANNVTSYHATIAFNLNNTSS